MYKVEKNKRKYKIFEIENCRVYTDTVHDTAFINNNKIIKHKLRLRDTCFVSLRDTT